MSYDLHKRDCTWKMLQPGCYVDGAGNGHIVPSEVIAHLITVYPEAGLSHTPEDYTLVVEALRQVLQDACLGVVFEVLQNREADA